MITKQRYDLAASIYLSTRGYGFVIAEGPESPVDWGTSEVHGPEKNRKCLLAVKTLVRRYHPDILILEDVKASYTPRSTRVVDLTTDIAEFAVEHGTPIYFISRDMIRQTFRRHGAETKDEVAEVIGERIPVFLSYVPPVRKPWMRVHSRMALFDAAAQLITAADHNYEGDSSSS